MFKDKVKQIYKKAKMNKKGENASYIPELAKVDSELFGMSLTIELVHCLLC